MFWWGFLVGLMVGATVSLFLYALIIVAKEADGLE